MDDNPTNSSGKKNNSSRLSTMLQQKPDLVSNPEDFKKSFEFDEKLGFKEDFSLSTLNSLSSTVIAENNNKDIRELLGSFVEDEIDQDKIFHSICSENQYHNDAECFICKKDFKLLNRKKIW